MLANSSSAKMLPTGYEATQMREQKSVAAGVLSIFATYQNASYHVSIGKLWLQLGIMISVGTAFAFFFLVFVKLSEHQNRTQP